MVKITKLSLLGVLIEFKWKFYATVQTTVAVLLKVIYQNTLINIACK